MKHQQDGYIILITVLILGLVASIAAGFLLLSGQNAAFSARSAVAGTNAKAAATACSELALAAIASNPSLTTPANGSQDISSSTGQTCTYQITGTAPTYTINAVGTVTQGGRNYLRRLTITTSQVSPSITVASWQDSQ